MKVQLSHVALLISDLEKAKQFYGNILGFQEIERPSFFINGLWYDLGGFELHLMLYEGFLFPQVHPLSETVQPHFALSMTKADVFMVIENLKNSGVVFIEDLSESPSEISQVFFYDFDKNMIELNVLST